MGLEGIDALILIVILHDLNVKRLSSLGVSSLDIVARSQGLAVALLDDVLYIIKKCFNPTRNRIAFLESPQVHSLVWYL